MKEDGRRVLVPNADLNYQIQPAMIEAGKLIKCCRCESNFKKAEVLLPSGDYYCPKCLSLGRITSADNLYYYPEQNREKLTNSCCWQGQLTEAQSKVSEKIVHAITTNQDLLVNAVTGAGKTEMLYQGIAIALEQGKRVCLATPRIDVCLELAPRLQRDFSGIEIAVLYGKSQEEYHDSQFVLCTTHQLLRFYLAFDCLIIDEIDAFPYANEEFLQVGVKNARKRQSSLILLTATPSSELLNQVAKKELKIAVLPARFHGFKLIVPQFVWCNHLLSAINNCKLPWKLLSLIANLLKSGNPLLIFCPTIPDLKKLEVLLRKKFPKLPFTSVSALDEERVAKVQKMRNGEYSFLLTTNILERGVTFPNLSVVVFGSNHRVFTKSTLVQISGRVGRSADHPRGKLYFVHDGISKAMKQARKAIKEMNNLAEKDGLLQDEL